MTNESPIVESICGCRCDKCRHSECCLGIYCGTTDSAKAGSVELKVDGKVIGTRYE